MGFPSWLQGYPVHSLSWPQNWSDLSGFPRMCWSSPIPSFSFWLTPAQERPQTRPALQGLAGLPVVPDHLVLGQLPHCMVTPESDFLTSWLQHVWPKGLSGHALHNIWHALSLGLHLANFLRKKNSDHLISFPLDIIVSFGGRRCEGKKMALISSCALTVFEIQWWRYMWEEEGFGRRAHSKTYWPEQSANHMLSTDDLY